MTSYTKNDEYTVFVLDNDECLGAWGIASALHSLYNTYIPQNTGIPLEDCMRVFRDVMVKHYLPNGGARPGMKDTLNLLKFYKDAGLVDRVVMFTSAGNRGDWVNVLKDCFEEYADVKGLYDLVLHRDNTDAKIAPDGSTLKSMLTAKQRLGFYPTDRVKFVVIDDKPQNIYGDSVLVGVSPYRHIVGRNHLSDMIDSSLTELHNMYTPSTEKKTYDPTLFRNTIKTTVLVDKNGIKREFFLNENVHFCSSNQLGDRDLIKKSVGSFIENIPPLKLMRSTTAYPLKIPTLVRSNSG